MKRKMVMITNPLSKLPTALHTLSPNTWSLRDNMAAIDDAQAVCLAVVHHLLMPALGWEHGIDQRAVKRFNF